MKLLAYTASMSSCQEESGHGPVVDQNWLRAINPRRVIKQGKEAFVARLGISVKGDGLPDVHFPLRSSAGTELARQKHMSRL